MSSIAYDNDPIDEREETCERCKCCELVHVECPTCNGAGVDGHECGEDCCNCLQPEDNVACETCEGVGGWMACLGKCDDKGFHDVKAKP